MLNNHLFNHFIKTKAEIKIRWWRQFEGHLAVWVGGLLLFALPIVAQAQFTYTTNSGTVTITGYTGPGGAVTIPSTINGLPVTSIGHQVFAWSSLTSVRIPYGVTNIGYRAFWACFNLTAITVNALNPAYQSIDGVLFDKQQTTLIEYPGGKAGSYTIPSSVIIIGDYAFSETGVTSVTFPNSVTSIGYNAFYICPLTNVTMGNGLTSIGSYAFFLTGLKSVTIPSGVTNIGYYAFGYCAHLTSITLPNSVTTIGYDAFDNCTNLGSVTIGNSVTSIGYHAFADCTSLTSVYFKGNAPSADATVFSGDNNATVYYLPRTTGWGPTFGGRPTALWDPPTLLTSPQTQTAEAGSAVDLSAHATNSLPLFYLWYLDATNLLSCGTNCELQFTNVQFAQSGPYIVVVSNVFGAVTSAPAMLNVTPAVERRMVPSIKVTGDVGSELNVDYANSLSCAPDWATRGSVSLTSTSQFYFDLTAPLPPQRFYRAWQTGTPSVVPSLNLNFVPAVTLTGSAGDALRLDYINAIGPTDAWVTLDTVTLTNTSQLYFDVSAPAQPTRLYRIVPVP